MEYLDQPFHVPTGSGRRPTPLAYEHLREWLAKDERFLELHSHVDITNIDQQLDQTSKIMISNVIQRVIAQIIGDKDPGFVSIKGTDGGALHVYPAGGAADGKIDVKVEDGDDAALGAIADAIVAAGAEGTLSAKLRRVTQGLEDLKSVKIAGTSQTEKSAAINIATAATHDIIAVDGTKSHHITSIMFTVAGEVNVTLKDDGSVTSGAMDFGGTDEPRGVTHNFGLVPLVCGAGKKFQILLSAAVQVSGIVTYYSE